MNILHARALAASPLNSMIAAKRSSISDDTVGGSLTAMMNETTSHNNDYNNAFGFAASNGGERGDPKDTVLDVMLYFVVGMVVLCTFMLVGYTFGLVTRRCIDDDPVSEADDEQQQIGEEERTSRKRRMRRKERQQVIRAFFGPRAYVYACNESNNDGQTNKVELSESSSFSTAYENDEGDLGFEKVCCICLSEYYDKTRESSTQTSDDQSCKVLQGTFCSHVYHYDCALEWLYHHEHCPYCRRTMIAGDQLRETALTVLGPERVAQLDFSVDDDKMVTADADGGASTTNLESATVVNAPSRADEEASSEVATATFDTDESSSGVPRERRPQAAGPTAPPAVLVGDLQPPNSSSDSLCESPSRIPEESSSLPTFASSDQDNNYRTSDHDGSRQSDAALVGDIEMGT